jgi:hypothetical protein
VIVPARGLSGTVGVGGGVGTGVPV